MPARASVVIVFCLASASAAAQGVPATGSPPPAAAYQAGWGGCHRREASVLRAIPAGSEDQRRAWIERFMAAHPNERESLAPLIVEYLLDRTRR